MPAHPSPAHLPDHRDAPAIDAPEHGQLHTGPLAADLDAAHPKNAPRSSPSRSSDHEKLSDQDQVRSQPAQMPLGHGEALDHGDTTAGDTTARLVVADAALVRGFTQIPNHLLRMPRLSPGAKLTYLLLLSYAWQEQRCFPGQTTLARDLGAGRRSVVRYLQELRTVGLLQVQRRGLGKTNVYYLPRPAARTTLGGQPPQGQQPGRQPDPRQAKDRQRVAGDASVAHLDVTGVAQPHVPDWHRDNDPPGQTPIDNNAVQASKLGQGSVHGVRETRPARETRLAARRAGGTSLQEVTAGTTAITTTSEVADNAVPAAAGQGDRRLPPPCGTRQRRPRQGRGNVPPAGGAGGGHASRSHPRATQIRPASASVPTVCKMPTGAGDTSPAVTTQAGSSPHVVLSSPTVAAGGGLVPLAELLPRLRSIVGRDGAKWNGVREEGAGQRPALASTALAPAAPASATPPPAARKRPRTRRERPGQPGGHPAPERGQEAHPGGTQGLLTGRSVSRRASSMSAVAVRRHRPRSTPYLAAVMADLSTQFYDEQPRSSLTRALRLLDRSGLTEQGFVNLLYELRSLARQSRVTKRRAGGGLLNRMPFFFACLEDRLTRLHDRHTREAANVQDDPAG